MPRPRASLFIGSNSGGVRATSSSKRRADAAASRGEATIASIGHAYGLAQKRSNTADCSGTTGPVAITSMSMKFAPALRMKYSSAMLRPPETDHWLSAMKSLLCIRWLMRPKSNSEKSRRAARVELRDGSGLKSRTSTLGSEAKLRNSSSSPAV